MADDNLIKAGVVDPNAMTDIQKKIRKAEYEANKAMFDNNNNNNNNQGGGSKSKTLKKKQQNIKIRLV